MDDMDIKAEHDDPDLAPNDGVHGDQSVGMESDEHQNDAKMVGLERTLLRALLNVYNRPMQDRVQSKVQIELHQHFKILASLLCLQHFLAQVRISCSFDRSRNLTYTEQSKTKHSRT